MILFGALVGVEPMFVRKLLTACGITLLIALMVISSVLAAPASNSLNSAGVVSNRFGQVKSISNYTVTFQTLGGEKRTFLVTGATQYFGIKGVVRSASDMKKGSWVNAIGTLNASNQMVASIVILLPSSIDTSVWDNPRDFGTVTKVSVSASTFVLSGRNGKATYTVDSSTTFPSNVQSLSKLKRGMTVSLAYQETDSTLLVTGLVAWGTGTATVVQPSITTTTVSNRFNVSYNEPADIWQGRTGAYFPASAYTGMVTLTREGMGNDTRMDRQLGQQNLTLMSPYLDFQLQTSAGAQVDRIVGLAYVYFNLYSGDLTLWRNHQLAIYTYDPINQKWVECLANQLVINGVSSYRLACIATQTGIYALVQTPD
jgi:hypothetical protein